MIDGLSSRNYSKVIKGFSQRTGISKSSVSRAFLRASQKDLDQLNHADLSSYRFIGIMVDGSDYARRAIIGAIGITDQCEKIPLGIREGDTENAEVVKDLLSSILERNFTFAGDRILAVVDGGKALKKALKDVWGDRVLIQRCWIHKLRNLKNYAPEKYHGQIGWRMKKLMNLVSFAEAKRELASFIHWLDNISYEAAQSLREVGGELLTVIELEVPRELRKNLSCTNAMESLFGVCRSRTRKVKNWKYHPRLKKKIPRDKILRWVASSILEHLPKLRKLKGFKHVHLLIAALTEKKIEMIRKEA
jgi:transposase-like protein